MQKVQRGGAMMETEREVLEAISDRLKDELDVEQQRLPAEIVEKLFAVEAAEAKLQS